MIWTIAALLATAAPTPATSTVTLEINTAEVAADAKVVVQLYDDAKGFADVKGPLAQKVVTPQPGGVTRVVLEGVAPGQYAGLVFVDLDGDGELGTSWLGIPAEPVGVTIPPGLRVWGAPSFKQAAFMAGSEPVTRAVSLWVP